MLPKVEKNMPNPEITSEEIQEYIRGEDIKYFCKTYFDVDFDENKFKRIRCRKNNLLICSNS